MNINILPITSFMSKVKDLRSGIEKGHYLKVGEEGLTTYKPSLIMKFLKRIFGIIFTQTYQELEKVLTPLCDRSLRVLNDKYLNIEEFASDLKIILDKVAKIKAYSFQDSTKEKLQQVEAKFLELKIELAQKEKERIINSNIQRTSDMRSFFNRSDTPPNDCVKQECENLIRNENTLFVNIYNSRRKIEIDQSIMEEQEIRTLLLLSFYVFINRATHKEHQEVEGKYSMIRLRCGLTSLENLKDQESFFSVIHHYFETIQKAFKIDGFAKILDTQLKSFTKLSLELPLSKDPAIIHITKHF